jgi:branched-chain amino acid transport system ATP-binding protein
MARVRMGLGRSFQIPQPFEGLTAFENCLTAAAFGRNSPSRRWRRTASRSSATPELLHRANTHAGTLTLLDRKRLELARALATGPQLLLLDEIAGGLTEGECKALVETIRAVHARA